MHENEITMIDQHNSISNSIKFLILIIFYNSVIKNIVDLKKKVSVSKLVKPY